VVLLLPLAFTAGMTLIDTLDGVLMLGAYGWAYIKPIRKLYYNLNITFISVIIALVIGSIEVMQVIFPRLKLNGGFFGFIRNLDFGNLGYFIIVTFILSWLLSIAIYRWKNFDRYG
jgi:nickel/cobalt transporter (NiCoT) family protein